MRVPHKIKLGGYEIKCHSKKKLLGANGEELWGEYDKEKNTVWLQAGMPKQRKKEVFFHELLHAIDDIYALRLGERKVGLLAVTIIDLIKTNHIDLINE